MIGTELRIRVLPAIAEVPAEAWNACANPVDAMPAAVHSVCEHGDSESPTTVRSSASRPVI